MLGPNGQVPSLSLDYFTVCKKISTYDYIIMQRDKEEAKKAKARDEEDVISVASSKRSKRVCGLNLLLPVFLTVNYI